MCRQPRYPQEVPEDRRFCAPALRRVCLCQQSACWPRSTHARWTDTVRDLRSSPLPGVIAGLYGVGRVSSPTQGRPERMRRKLATLCFHVLGRSGDCRELAARKPKRFQADAYEVAPSRFDGAACTVDVLTTGDDGSRLVPRSQRHPPTVVGQRPALVVVAALERRGDGPAGAVIQTQDRFRLVGVVLVLQRGPPRSRCPGRSPGCRPRNWLRTGASRSDQHPSCVSSATVPLR